MRQLLVQPRLRTFHIRQMVLKPTISNSKQLLPGVAFEEVEHTADCALRIYGRDLQELLLNAAHAMNSLMLMDFIPLSTIEVERSVNLNTLDAESLLVEWLSELAFWAETEMLVFHKFDMEHVSSTQVLSTAYGSRVAQLDKHIKAVTYHNLKISETEVGLSAVVVFDV